MKYFLFVCCLLALSRVALADEAFPAFVAGQGATGSITGTELMPVIQGGVTTKDTLSGLKTYFQSGGNGGGVPNVTVLTPVAGDNAPQLTTALSGATTVELSPGYYMVCSQVDIPRGRTLFGTDGVRQGIGNQVPAYPFTSMQPTVVGSNGCPSGGNGTFTASGQGYFHLHDNVTVTGFAIQGQRQVGGHNAINCINAENAATIAIFAMTLVDCYNGVDRLSSSVSGDTGSISQTAIISFNSIPYVENYGIICGTGSGGNGCADERYTENWFDVPGVYAINVTGGQQVQITNNRMEDSSTGIQLDGGAAYIVISGCLFNRISAMDIDTGGAANVIFVGNKMSGVEPGNIQEAITIGGPATNLIVTNNLFSYNYIAAFRIFSTGSVGSSKVYGNVSGVPMFYSATSNHTAGQLAPQVNSVVSSNDGSFETFTTSASTVSLFASAGPTGDPIAARLTENGATSAHSLGLSVSGNTGSTFTSLAYFSPGSSGSRNAVINVTDGTNSATGVYNPSTCAVVTSSHGGSASLPAPASAISVGGGWCLGALTFTGVGPMTESVGLASGSSTSYAGDSASNLLFWNLGRTAGAVAPGIIAQFPQ